MSHTFRYECPLQQGLHARPATALAGHVESLPDAVTLTNLRSGQQANARSVLSLISADVRLGDSCDFEAVGPTAESTLRSLKTYVEQELIHVDDDLSVPDPDSSASDQSVEVPRSLAMLSPCFIQGRGLNAGIGIGKAVIITGPKFTPELLDLPGEGLEKELYKFRQAVAVTRQTLLDNIQSSDDTGSAVLTAHLAIVKDEEFVAHVEQALSEAGTSSGVARALSEAVDHFEQILCATGNPYLKERALDIVDVAHQILQACYGEAARVSLPVLESPAILVADALTPGDFIAMNGPNLKGLVMESGGATSHTVLLARGSGVPTLGGVSAAIEFAESAQSTLIIDGTTGILVNGGSPDIEFYFESERDKLISIERRLLSSAAEPALTRDGMQLEVAANLALAEDAEAAFAAGAEGIGLFRTEMMFLGDQPPSIAEQEVIYRKVLDAANGRPVIIRTIDVGGDKPAPWLKMKAEENPFLGVRGVRLYRQHESLFRDQLMALLQAAGDSPLRIMVPMISSADELEWARSVFDEVRAVVVDSTANATQVEFGIMLEVPAVAWALKALSKHCDFFSIGSNDLLQYFMACDRGNDELGYLYSPYQPAFLRLLKDLADGARAQQTWIGLCGDFASDTHALPLLVGLALDEISLSAPQIPIVKSRMAQLDGVACRVLLQDACKCSNQNEVLELLDQFNLDSTTEPLFDPALVTFSPQAPSKAAAIKQLVDLAHLAGRTDQCAALENAVWAREEVFSTGLGFGIAIPHCKSASVKSNSLCIARYENPLDWEARDGEPVDTVIMLLVRENDAGDAHMKIFAQLARNIMHEPFRDELRACPDAGSLLEFLQASVQP